MVQYIQPICWLLPLNCLGILDDLVWPGLQRLKVMSVALIILLKLVHMCIYIATKNSFYDNSTFLNYSVFLTLTVIKPFCITCITICSWKRNTLRDILRKNGVNIGKIIWKIHILLLGCLIWHVHCSSKRIYWSV